jgi:DNA-binding response OmpR family regulator
MTYVFEATLEAAERPTGAPSEERAEEQQLLPDPPRILHIEDDDDDAFLVHEWMQDAADGGAEMSRAQRLQDALFRLKEQPFDVVIFDLGLPDSVGIEGIALIREADSSVPILVLSGHDDAALAAAVIEQGADRYFSKLATSPEELVHSVLDTIRAAGIGVMPSSLVGPERELSLESATKTLLNQALRKDTWRRTWCLPPSR